MRIDISGFAKTRQGGLCGNYVYNVITLRLIVFLWQLVVKREGENG